MKMTHDQVFACYPNVYMQFRPQLAHFPTIFNLSGDCVVGNGSGFHNEAIYSGFGEYIERYHFYNEIDINYTATLNKFNLPNVVDKFIKLIEQVRKTTSSIKNHEFDLTITRNIFTDKIAYIPTAVISLAHIDSPDRLFIPFVDSCGQSAHITRGKAFQSAWNEFIERQALIGAWLSGKARFQIKFDLADELQENKKVLSSLMLHGELFAFEINNDLPGYSVIIFYFSKSKKDSVLYSVGMASDLCPNRAFQRAVNELWQSYVFMYLNADCPENLDQRYKYLNDLIYFNNHDTRNDIPFFKDKFEIVKFRDFISMKIIKQKQAMDELQSISSHVYSYEKSSNLFGRKFYFCKITSPDFFLHMGVKMPLNFNNTYSNRLAIDPNIKVKNAIPFP